MTQKIAFHALDDTLPGAAAVGARARRLARMRAAGLPVPEAVALDFAGVRALMEGAELPDLPAALGWPLALRASAGDPAWGGPQAMLNVGLGAEARQALAAAHGPLAALEVERRLIQSYGTRVAGLDAEDFENLYYDHLKLEPEPGDAALATIVAATRDFYEEEDAAPFPKAAEAQLHAAIRAIAREWHGPTARILRDAKGAPADAGLGLILQRMVFGLGEDSGAGAFQPVESATGRPARTGRFLPNAQGTDAQRGARTPHLISAEERQSAGQSLPSMEEMFPEVYAELLKCSTAITGL
ncbi:MAG: hypothetical protein AAFY59_05810, partial [Pseudomonadota bacterium]